MNRGSSLMGVGVGNRVNRLVEWCHPQPSTHPKYRKVITHSTQAQIRNSRWLLLLCRNTNFWEVRLPVAIWSMLAQARLVLCGSSRSRRDTYVLACISPLLYLAQPTCSDGLQNQDETDVDCGGTKCSKCFAGRNCKTTFDCNNGLCVDGICRSNSYGFWAKWQSNCSSLLCSIDATCWDSLPNGLETDVDCGGPSCKQCLNSQHCSTSTDCVSKNCARSICLGKIESHKSNGVFNRSPFVHSADLLRRNHQSRRNWQRLRWNRLWSMCSGHRMPPHIRL